MSRSEYILFIYLPLPRKVARRIQALRRSIGGKHLITEPHITVYLCRFTPRSYKKLVNQLTQEKFQKFPVALSSLVMKVSKNGGHYYFLRTTGSAMHAFHRRMVALANPLRGDLIRSRELPRLKHKLYSRQELAYLKKYGYVDVLDKYKPHITISDSVPLDPKVKQKLKERTKDIPRKFTVTTAVVGLYKYTTDRYTKLAEEIITLH